eukprot:FR735566.1.p1 GENE.FR735566.1~~FR735566.1.p1  ORF type:complete len:259 (-),score=38.85 FR735566.1:87-863(-)
MEGSFLESYIETISALPNEFRRHFELMRTLAKERAPLNKEVAEEERRIITDTRRRLRESSSQAGGDADALEHLHTKRQRAAQMADEKVQIAEQTFHLAENYISKLDNELTKFEDYLRTSGEFFATGAAPGEQIAARPKDEWILARVQEYDINSGFYTVSDEDDQTKTYSVSESLVVLLEGARLTRGEEVYAIYPDTTSFYPATVTFAPRRSASATNGPVFCTVQFRDDENEEGITPDRQIALQYVIKPPEEEEGSSFA